MIKEREAKSVAELAKHGPKQDYFQNINESRESQQLSKRQQVGLECFKAILPQYFDANDSKSDTAEIVALTLDIAKRVTDDFFHCFPN